MPLLSRIAEYRPQMRQAVEPSASLSTSQATSPTPSDARWKFPPDRQGQVFRPMLGQPSSSGLGGSNETTVRLYVNPQLGELSASVLSSVSSNAYPSLPPPSPSRLSMQLEHDLLSQPPARQTDLTRLRCWQ